MRRDDDCELLRMLADDFVGEEDAVLGGLGGGFRTVATGVRSASSCRLLFVGADPSSMELGSGDRGWVRLRDC